MRKRSLLALMLTGLLMLSACQNAGETSSKEESSQKPEISADESSAKEISQAESSVQNSSAEESSQEAVVPEGNLNLLTGLYDLTDEAVGKRPVAIMINNIKDSLPQYGIAGADILFEIPVESGITRMMALWGDYTQIPDVCSVRSCRYYYPVFAAGFDAVYIHVGASTSGTQMLEQLGIDHFNGISYGDYIFERDPERLEHYALEHTMYVKGQNIPSAMEAEGMRTDLEEEYQSPVFQFNLPGQLTSNPDESCEKLTIHFSEEYFSTFTYNTGDGLYYKEHSGQPHMVQDTGTQLAFTNVFVLETDIGSKDGYLKEVDCTGGTGYYISNGTMQEIRWQKKDAFDRIRLMDTDGNELQVNAGKSFIGVTQYDTVDFE